MRKMPYIRHKSDLSLIILRWNSGSIFKKIFFSAFEIVLIKYFLSKVKRIGFADLPPLAKLFCICWKFVIGSKLLIISLIVILSCFRLWWKINGAYFLTVTFKFLYSKLNIIRYYFLLLTLLKAKKEIYSGYKTFFQIFLHSKLHVTGAQKPGFSYTLGLCHRSQSLS